MTGCSLAGIACCDDRLHDGNVAGAPAQVSRQYFTNARFRSVGFVSEEGVGSRQHSRRAETALQRVVLPKRCLQGRQARRWAQAFDRDDRTAGCLYRKHQAGSDCCAIDDDGAGATYAMLAADMRTGQREVMSQTVGQRSSCLGSYLDPTAVYRELHLHLLALRPPRAHPMAAFM